MGTDYTPTVIIGMRIPKKSVFTDEIYYKNFCKCNPQTKPGDSKFCPDCGGELVMKRVRESTALLIHDEHNGGHKLKASTQDLEGLGVITGWGNYEYVYIGAIIAQCDGKHGPFDAGKTEEEMDVIVDDNNLRGKLDTLEGILKEAGISDYEMGLWLTVVLS